MRFPRIEAFELPFVVSDATSGSRAVWKFYQQYAQQEFAAFKVLAFQVDGGQAAHTGSRPIKALADWKGAKLRTSPRLGTRTAEALGATPVEMPPSRLTEFISKGVVDGAMGAWELVSELKLDEVTKFHAQPPTGQPYPSATVLMVLMNNQKYDGLPADLKALIDKYTGAEMIERLTFRRGDILLTGVAYQAARADVGARVRVEAGPLDAVEFAIAAAAPEAPGCRA